jgi:DNA-binding MarR family transcriptional regulator
METSDDGLPVTALADMLAADFERVLGLFRSLSQPSGLSMTAAGTLATLERGGPTRLTLLAAREGVTQPAMTQLIARLEEAGQVRRDPSPDDGRVVLVAITDEGRATLARRRVARADKLAGLLSQLSPEHREALTAAMPALAALAGLRRDDDPIAAGRG